MHKKLKLSFCSTYICFILDEYTPPPSDETTQNYVGAWCRCPMVLEGEGRPCIYMLFPFSPGSWPQQLASGQCNTTLSTIAPSYNDIDQSIDRFVHTGLTTHARRAARRTTHVGIVEPRASRPAPGLHWTYARCMRCKTVTEYHISPCHTGTRTTRYIYESVWNVSQTNNRIDTNPSLFSCVHRPGTSIVGSHAPPQEVAHTITTPDPHTSNGILVTGKRFGH